MVRPIIPSRQLAEKLTILNDRGIGMLTRIYNTRKVCSDTISKPAFLSEKSLESAIKQVARKLPSTDTKANSQLGSVYNNQSYRILDAKSLRRSVYREIICNDEISGVEWRRFPGLNRLLKGHRRGELTVFTGPTGTGKTTFLSEYSLDLCAQGVKTLWGSFEIRNVRLMKLMLSQLAFKNIVDHVEVFDIYADQLEELPMYFMDFHGSQTIKDVLDTMHLAVEKLDVQHIIIDNVQFMLGSGPADKAHRGLDRFQYQDLLIDSFRKFATNHNRHITLVIHPRKETTEELSNNSIFGGAKAIQEADNILILQTVTDVASFKTKKFLQVTKNRFNGQLGAMPLQFDAQALSYGLKFCKSDAVLSKSALAND